MKNLLMFLIRFFKRCHQDHEMYYRKGLSFQNLGRNQEAIECFKEAMKLAPDEKTYSSRLSNALSLNEKEKED